MCIRDSNISDVNNGVKITNKHPLVPNCGISSPFLIQSSMTRRSAYSRRSKSQGKTKINWKKELTN